MSGQNIIAGIVTFTALSSYINHQYFRLPRTIGVTIITLIVACLLLLTKQQLPIIGDQLILYFSSFDFNHAFLEFMLSFMLFAGALHTNVFDLAKEKTLLICLTTVSVIISTLAIGGAIWMVGEFLTLPMPLSMCFMFGALISPTDPIAVFSILRHLKIPKDIEIKFAGEALFNDGIGIVLFVFFLGYCTSADNQTTVDMMVFFIREAIGGVVAGIILGIICGYLVKKIDNYELAMMITLSLVTGGYTFTDQILDVSGVLTIVVAGLIIGYTLPKSKMPKKSILQLNQTWKLIDQLLNAMLFVLIGLECLSLHITPNAVLYALSAIGIVIMGRWLSVAIPIQFLPNLYQTSKQNLVWIMTWGGLRGGVSIALALSIPAHLEQYDILVSITYSVVLFSIIVQGLTIKPLIKKLIA